MDDKERAIRKRLKDDLPHYAAKCLKIRTKSGLIVPLVLNVAQMYIHQKVEEQRSNTGRVRAIILKGRQQGCCYSPEMRVLTADYRWVRLADIAVGERIYSVEEDLGELNKAGRRKERRVKVAVVEAKVFLKRQAFEVVTSTGVKLIVTGEHRHLCQQRGGCLAQWRAVTDTKIGDYIRVFCDAPKDVSYSFEDGWFGGLLDGEGTFGASPHVRIGLNQIDGAVLRRAKEYLKSKNIGYYELIDRRTSGVSSKLGDKPVHCLRIDRQSDIIKLLTLTRPSRFIDRALFEGKKLPKTCKGFEAWAEVVSITAVGEIDVIDCRQAKRLTSAKDLCHITQLTLRGAFTGA